jgi:DNA-binding XRE family transcriptional regulator
MLEKAGECSKLFHIRRVMGVLEIIAERHLGARALKMRPHLQAALTRIEKAAAKGEENERIASIVDLCFEYEREQDSEERKNILRTLEEISANEPLGLPRESIDEWDERLRAKDAVYPTPDEAASRRRTPAFLKRYFSLRSKAGLSTQAEVARMSGLSRSYIAVIESGEHAPQQKTLQKLAKAFGVDVANLIP